MFQICLKFHAEFRSDDNFVFLTKLYPSANPAQKESPEFFFIFIRLYYMVHLLQLMPFASIEVIFVSFETWNSLISFVIVSHSASFVRFLLYTQAI